MDIKLKDIINICNAKLIFGNEDIICENFSKDTRTIQENDVYVGIKGENFDGNMLYEEALKKGAKVCILQGMNAEDFEENIEKSYKNDKEIIIVENTIEALQQIASYKRSLYNIPVIAITGSVGKTSTKDIIASVVNEEFDVLKTQGNLNNHIGVPLTILGLKNHKALVVEMGMNNLGEISVLSKIAKPDIAVITNVGTSHIGNLGSRENILKAKLEILDGLKDNGVLIINNDNDLLNSWAKTYNGNVKIITYGIENKSDIMAKNIVQNENSSEFDVSFFNEIYGDFEKNVIVPVGGKHFVYNALSAICVGIQLKIQFSKIRDGIYKFELTKNRMEIEKINNITIINDCYNANYDSMKAGIENLARLQGKRKIAILGDMLELGEFSKDLHCKVGEEVAKNKIDILITVGNESKNIAETAKKHGMNEENIFIFENNNQVINLINKIKKDDDCILIKASNGMHFIELVNNLKTGE